MDKWCDTKLACLHLGELYMLFQTLDKSFNIKLRYRIYRAKNAKFWVKTCLIILKGLNQSFSARPGPKQPEVQNNSWEIQQHLANKQILYLLKNTCQFKPKITLNGSVTLFHVRKCVFENIMCFLSCTQKCMTKLQKSVYANYGKFQVEIFLRMKG